MTRCNNSGGRGIGAGHTCRCNRPARHPLDSDRPHGCECGAMWAENDAPIETIVMFLVERIDEDERRARGAVDWEPLRSPLAIRHRHASERTSGAFPSRRVLVECEAKRRIVEWHEATCSWRADPPCRTLQLLALPYADHPDYRPEWSPDA